MEETANSYPVAVINANEDIIDLIRLLLDDEGIPSISGHVIDFKRGRKDLLAFLREHNPRVIVYDISPPYEENWKFFQLVKNAKEADGREFILTTTNKTALEQLVGKTDAIEIIGKPFDLEEVITSIKQKLQR
jgi:DNA-binding NtrC family response regulator